MKNGGNSYQNDQVIDIAQHYNNNSSVQEIKFTSKNVAHKSDNTKISWASQ